MMERFFSFHRLLLFLTLCAPLALQVQIDILEAPGYVGLRLALVDLLLPIAGVGIGISLLLGKSRWPDFRAPGMPLWLAAITVVLGISLAMGYSHTGEISRWGLTNKFFGWLVLLSLFLWGAWAATNLGEQFPCWILRVFVATFLAIAVLGTGVLFLRDAGILDEIGVFSYPLSGLMGNRNSFALLLCVISVLIGLYSLKGSPLIPHLATLAFFVALPLLHALIGSRAGWVIQPVILGGLIVIGKKEGIRTLLLPLLAGCLLLGGLSATGAVSISRGYQLYLFSQIDTVVTDKTLDYRDPQASEKYHRQSDAYRMQAAYDALDLWKTSPLAGAGLGSFLDFQTRKYGEYLDVIDNSLLWLLAETGIIGLLTFLGFYGTCLYFLSRSRDPLALSVIGMMLVFGMFSLFHEMLYTRFLWFLMGIGMGSEGVRRDQGADGIRMQGHGPVEANPMSGKEIGERLEQR